MSKTKKALWIILAVVLLLAAVIAVNHQLVRVLLQNWFPEKIALDTSAVWEGGKSYERLVYASDSGSQYHD